MLVNSGGRGEGWWVDTNTHKELDDSSTFTNLTLDYQPDLSPKAQSEAFCIRFPIFLNAYM